MPGEHLVFLVYLAVALLWNLHAAGRRPGETKRPPSQTLLVPLVLVLVAVLVRDRLADDATPWLLATPARHLWPLAFLGAIAQNVRVLLSRGVRLSDIPFVLFNVGVGAAVTVADLSASGVPLDRVAQVLLYDHSVLQVLLGSPFAQAWTVCWHVPFLLRRRPPRHLLDVVGGLLPGTIAAFGAVILVSFHASAERVLATFDEAPRLEGGLRTGLEVGVWARPRGPGAPGAIGRLRAWVLPADHPGSGLPADDGRPLVLQLGAPADAAGRSREELEAAFLAGAERLAGTLRPAVLLPFPEPDGEATLLFGADDGPYAWAARLGAAVERVRGAAPETAVAVRLRGHGERSRALFEALAPLVDVMGPRLEPGGDDPEHPSQRGARLAGVVLDAWRSWRATLEEPPRLWVLAAGCSPLALGEEAQERFVEACLARADGDPDVEAVLVDGWRDRGHTRGVVRPDGTARRAGQRLLRLVGSHEGRADR